MRARLGASSSSEDSLRENDPVNLFTCSSELGCDADKRLKLECIKIDPVTNLVNPPKPKPNNHTKKHTSVATQILDHKNTRTRNTGYKTKMRTRSNSAAQRYKYTSGMSAGELRFRRSIERENHTYDMRDLSQTKFEPHKNPNLIFTVPDPTQTHR